MSLDGSLLMVSVAGGVRFVQVYAQLAAAHLSTRAVAGKEKPIQLKGVIGNGDSLIYEIATQPAHGNVTSNGDAVSYVPALGFKGKDSFRYRVRYGRATAEAVASVLVMPAL